MFERILLPIDFTADSDRVLEYAKGFRELGLKEVLLVHGIDPSAVETKYYEQEMKNIHGRMSEKGQIFKDAGIAFRNFVEDINLLDEKIAEVAEREKATLIITGSHGKSPWEEILYGSVSEKVGRKARVPVLILRYAIFNNVKPSEHAAVTFRQILFATDLTPSSDKAFEIVKRVGPKEVTILYVIPAKDDLEEYKVKELKATAETRFEAMRQDLEALGIKPSTLIRSGDVLSEIIQSSAHMTCIVIASHGKGVLQEWLQGSVSLNVARKAPVPVMLTHEHDLSQ